MLSSKTNNIIIDSDYDGVYDVNYQPETESTETMAVNEKDESNDKRINL